MQEALILQAGTEGDVLETPILKGFDAVNNS
jgi:hypothetical protein